MMIKGIMTILTNVIDVDKLLIMKKEFVRVAEQGCIRSKNMSDDYIRRGDAKDALQEKIFHNLTDEFYGAMQVLDELEPADVVPAVRCKECKFRENDDFCTGRGFPYQLVPDDGFCDKGERKE